jgi:hypothetical protein
MSAGFYDRPETVRGQLTYQGLIVVHDFLRRELDTLEHLSAAIVDGLPPDEVQARLGALRTGSLLWQFTRGCLSYCSIVHRHHHSEDGGFFPELRAANPEIGPVIGTLMAQHRAVSDLLDAVERAAAALSNDDRAETRKGAAESLDVLRDHLLAHFAFEEHSLETTIRRLSETPGPPGLSLPTQSQRSCGPDPEPGR